METLVEALRTAISSAEKLPKTDRPLPIVLSGGTAKPKGFKELFERTLQRALASRSRSPGCAWPPTRSPPPRAGR